MYTRYKTKLCVEIAQDRGNKKSVDFLLRMLSSQSSSQRGTSQRPNFKIDLVLSLSEIIYSLK